MRYLLVKATLTAAMALWLLGPISATAAIIEHDFNFSTAGTGTFDYDDVVMDIPQLTLDFDTFGSLGTDFNVELTDSLFGAPPNSFIKIDNTFFALSSGTANGLRLNSDGTFCVRPDNDFCGGPSSGQADLDSGTYSIAPVAQISCVSGGFKPPFDVQLMLKAKVKRAIPMKMMLTDGTNVITDLDVSAPPVVNVLFSPTPPDGGGDVTAQLLPLGQANEDNIFRYDDITQTWIYNLGTKPFVASGTYEVFAVAGDGSYEIDDSCTGTFIRQE